MRYELLKALNKPKRTRKWRTSNDNVIRYQENALILIEVLTDGLEGGPS
jgi:hypothetical protein